MTVLKLEGIIDQDTADELLSRLTDFPFEKAPLSLDMSEADVEDGVATATLISAIRIGAARLGSLHVIEPPQVLAHSLYRIGALGSTTIHLVRPREEIGSAS